MGDAKEEFVACHQSSDGDCVFEEDTACSVCSAEGYLMIMYYVSQNKRIFIVVKLVIAFQYFHNAPSVGHVSLTRVA